MGKNKYKKNFLTNVVFKLDFPIQSDYGLDNIKKFQKLIKKEFPLIEEKRGFAIEYKVDKTEEIETKTEKIKGWFFFDKTKNKIISFESNNIILEFKEYNTFKDYFKILSLVIESLLQIFPSIVSTRIGLRFINNIKLDDSTPFEWDNLLVPELFRSMDFLSDKKNMVRHLTLLELNMGDYMIKFQYGIGNSLYPSPIIRKEFVLDYDCFTHESLGEPEEILKKITKFNKGMAIMFEQCIGDGLRKIMEVI